MKMRFTIQSLLLVILAVALGTAWCLDSLRSNGEIQQLKSRLQQIHILNRKLETERNHLMSCEIEWEHFATLARDQVAILDVMLDTQRRKSSTQIRIFDIKERIACLLDPNKTSNLDNPKQQIFASEINNCRQLLVKYQNKPNSNPQAITQLTDQINYYESSLSNHAR